MMATVYEARFTRIIGTPAIALLVVAEDEEGFVRKLEYLPANWTSVNVQSWING